MHLRAEGGGKPITFVLTAGQRHDRGGLPALLEQGAVRQQGRGRPRLRPQRVVGDKGYCGKKIRSYLRRRGPFDHALYRMRNRVERLVNRLKQFRRVATRYEKRAVNYLAMVTIAAILLWL